MSCLDELQDIEDMLVGDVSEAPRKNYKEHMVKKALKKKKADAQPKEEKEYEPSRFANA
jgi:hypothetical protein